MNDRLGVSSSATGKVDVEVWRFVDDVEESFEEQCLQMDVSGVFIVARGGRRCSICGRYSG